MVNEKTKTASNTTAEFIDLAFETKAQRDEMARLLREISERLNDEADITNGGGPNLAMRLQTEFGSRIDALSKGGAR